MLQCSLILAQQKWSVYLILGNHLKYVRAQFNSGTMHHLAYISLVSILSSFKIYHCMIFGWQLPDAVQEFISSFHPKWRTQKDSILTHCRQELMHAVWKKLLDDDFIYAYTYGIVIKCIDGIERYVYLVPESSVSRPSKNQDQDQTRLAGTGKFPGPRETATAVQSLVPCDLLISKTDKRPV